MNGMTLRRTGCGRFNLLVVVVVPRYVWYEVVRSGMGSSKFQKPLELPSKVLLDDLSKYRMLPPS